MSKNIKTVPTRDYEEVIATVAKYVEGLRVGSVDGVAEAFHKDAVMYGFTKPDIKTRIDVLAITPTTAVVRVDMEKDAIGANYTDFPTLIKLRDSWHIIAKVYHMYEG